MSFRHGIARSIGAALGLFAMLVVTLLAPVHQAHAAQRDLARASGEWLGTQVICHGDLSGEAQADTGNTTDNGSTVKCPVCSLAKQVGATPSPVLAGLPAVWNANAARHLVAVEAATSQPERTAQPRAPPIPV